MKSYLIKAGLTALMLLIIIDQVDVNLVMRRFAALEPLTIVMCFAIAFSQMLLLAHRWMVVSRMTAVSLPRIEFVRCILASQFFNQGLPASIGGDALRVWWLVRAGVPIGRTTRNIFIDRLSGFLSLLALNVPAVPLLAWLVGRPDAAIGIAIILSIGTAAAIAAGSRPGRQLTIQLSKMARGSERADRMRAILRWITTLQASIARLFFTRMGMIVLFWGILIHLITVLLCFILAMQADIALSVLGLLAVLPGVLLVSYLPISIGGWGVREGGLVVGLSLLGLSAEQAVFIGFALGALGLASSMAGAFIWLFSPIPNSVTGQER